MVTSHDILELSNVIFIENSLHSSQNLLLLFGLLLKSYCTALLYWKHDALVYEWLVA